MARLGRILRQRWRDALARWRYQPERHYMRAGPGGR